MKKIYSAIIASICLCIFNYSNGQVSQFPQVYYNGQGAGGNNLKVRTYASLNSPWITKLAPTSKIGAEYYTTSTENFGTATWAKVCLPSSTGSIKYGYMMYGSMYIRISEINNYAKVNASSLYIRPCAGCTSSNVTINGDNAFFGQNSIVALTGNSSNEWYEVYLTDDCSQSTGWLYGGNGYLNINSNTTNYYNVAGTVKESSGPLIWGATVTMGSFTTNSTEGFYQYKLSPNWSGSITCTHPNYNTSSPTSYSYVATSHDYTKNFILSNNSCTTPGTPLSVIGSPTGQTSANLSWTAGNPPGSPTVTYYWVVGTDPLVQYGNGGVAEGTTTGTSVSTSELSCGTTYYLRVYAYTSCNGTQSGYGTSSAFSTSSCPLPPVVSFIIAEPHNISAGGSVTFSASITNNPTEWYWVFRGGTPYTTITSTSQSPQKVFSNPGSYSVTLKAKNSGGWGNLYATSNNFITVSPTSSNQCLPPNNYVIQKNYPSKYEAEPIDIATGSYEYRHSDFNLPAINTYLNFTRYYSSVNASVDGSLGYGWSHSYDYYVSNSSDSLWSVHYGDGHTSSFIPLYNGNGTSFPLYGGTYETLYKNPGTGLFTLTFKTGEIYYFNSSYKLSSITDLNGNTTNFNYDSGNLTSIVAPGGRTLSFVYLVNRISNVSDPLGRNVFFSYDGSGNLFQVTDPNSGTTGISYDGQHLIMQITTPNGNILLTNTYDGQNRVVAQSDALSNSTTIAYDTPANGDATIVYPGVLTSIVHHDDYFRLTQETDELGNSKFYSYDYNNNRTSATDENGNMKYSPKSRQVYKVING
jgi:YD repeat-containing protein